MRKERGEKRKENSMKKGDERVEKKAVPSLCKMASLFFSLTTLDLGGSLQ